MPDPLLDDGTTHTDIQIHMQTFTDMYTATRSLGNTRASLEP